MKDEHQIVRLARPVGERDHVMGPPSAAATLIEYGDYECPYCRQLHPVIREIMRRTAGLRLVYRHFPISKIHPHAIRAAAAAEAAAAQGRFWEMHDALFEGNQPLDDERLARVAKKIGLDLERFKREMDEGVYSARVSEGFSAALYEDGVTGTPTLYLNDVRLNNIQSPEVLLEAVIEAGATLQAGANEQTTWLGRLRKLRPGMTRLSS
jgi:formate-nitrite transporter family protein